MKPFQLTKRSSALFFGVAATWVALPSTFSQAATDPSWSDQPAWAAGDPSQPSRRSTLRESRNTNLSPFSPGSNNVSLDVGQIFLIGDLAKYDDNIGAQLHYTYGVSDLFGFDCSFGYSDHSNSQFTMASLLTGIRMNLSWYDKIVPFSILGVGFYRPAYQSALIAPPAGSTAPPAASGDSIAPILFGVHLGAGVDLQVTKQIFFGASLTFHDAFGGDKLTTNGQTVQVGGTYASFLLHAGVTF